MKKRTEFWKFLKLFGIALLIFGVAILVEYLADPSAANMATLRRDIIKSVLSSLVITVFIGTITKYIANDMLKVQKNDARLQTYGVYSVGTERFSAQDAADMFGVGLLNRYPARVDMLFLSGCHFLAQYKKELIRAIANGTTVRLLMVRPCIGDVINPYIPHYCALSGDRKILTNLRGTLALVAEITDAARCKNPNTTGSFEIRSYLDEFRNNQRYATYLHADKREIKCWLNVQATNTEAVSRSLLLRGYIGTADFAADNLSAKNLMYASYESFDDLWELYPSSTPTEADIARAEAQL